MTTLEMVHRLPIDGTEVEFVTSLPDSLPGATKAGLFAQAMPGDALVTLPMVGRYRIRDGRSLQIAPDPGCTVERAAYFANVTPLGILVHQRHELPLHASAVVRPADGKTLLVAGHSGAGKSTVAAAFAQRGWAVLNDDMSRITFNGTAQVWPGFARLKLWERSCTLLDLKGEALERTHQEKEKYYWTPARSSEPHPISAIVVIQKVEENRIELGGSPLAVEERRGGDAMKMLFAQTFRRRFVEPLGRSLSHFQQTHYLAASVRCYSAVYSSAADPYRLAAQLEALF